MQQIVRRWKQQRPKLACQYPSGFGGRYMPLSNPAIARDFPPHPATDEQFKLGHYLDSSGLASPSGWAETVR
jgi:hypothetical protein